MTSSKDEREARCDFAERYAAPEADVVAEVERAVIGDVWGANGFTTTSQADLLLAKVRVGEGDLLLDVGSGRGWPGLYIAKRSGCDVVVCDLPVEGLESAGRRASEEGMSGVAPVAASARGLPFRRGAFDAIVHTDVLC